MATSNLLASAANGEASERTRPSLDDALDWGTNDGVADEFDDLDGFAPGSSVGGFSASDFEVVSGRRQEAARIWPKGRTIELDDVQLAPADIAAEAAYPAPAPHVLAASYSAQVYWRRRALRRGIPALLEALQQAEGMRDDLVRDMVQQLRQSSAESARLHELFAPIEQAEQATRGEDQALVNVGEEAERAQAKAAQKLSELAASCDEEQAEAERRAQQRAKCERALRRVEARIERLHIELRNLRPGDGAVTSEVQRRIDEIDEEHARLQLELGPARADLKRAQTEHNEQQRRWARAEGELTRAQKQTVRTERVLGQRVAQKRHDLDETRALLDDALLRAGREILALRHDVPVENERLEAISSADEHANRAQTALSLRFRALDAYDAETYRRGWIVMAALLACIAALLIAL